MAIITGGANGIGRATADLFGAEGAHLVIADRDCESGETCVKEIIEAGGQAVFEETDVSRDDDVESLVLTATRTFGGIDILVNCAGVHIDGAVTDMEPDRWERVLNVNLSSMYRTCRAVIPYMIKRKGGSIVNVSSIMGMFGFPHSAGYTASKAAIIGLTRQVAVDYAPFDIRSNAVSPGGILTGLGPNSEILEPKYANHSSASDSSVTPAPASEPESDERPRLLRPGQPTDVGHAILFLASDEAFYITGHNLVVAGIPQSHLEGSYGL